MNVRFRLPGVDIEDEFGSLSEATGFLESDPNLSNLLSTVASIRNGALDYVPDESEAKATGESKPRRGRKSNAEKAAEAAAAQAAADAAQKAGAEAVMKAAAEKAASQVPAPAPAPIPTVPNPGTGKDGLGIPPFLDRSAAPPVPEAAPAPVPVPVPTATTTAPPLPAPKLPILGPKIAADIKSRAGTDPAYQKSLSDWLIQRGLPASEVATFDEVIAITMVTSDEQLASIAGALSITA